MKTITASDRSTLIRLASSLPTGDETRTAILNTLIHMVPVTDKEAGRTWDGKGNQKNYNQPPAVAKGGPPTCYEQGVIEQKDTGGKGTCYRLHNDYGKADSGKPGSAKRREYNKKYREKWMDSASISRKVSPDGHGGTINR
tara:strand:- start:3800 stop:4222 length:423 start_codon:yes stop_codon:yes gene_type:complete